MSQIQAAAAAVTLGSTLVTCTDPTVSWAQVVEGNLFSVFQSNLFYQIASANAPMALGSPWTLTLATPYVGATNAGITYVIVSNFTLNLGLPLPTATDSKINVMVGRIVTMLDTIINNIQTAITNLSGSTAYEAFVPGVNSLATMTAATPAATLPTGALRKFVDANGKLETYQLREADGDATNLDAGIAQVVDYGGANNQRAWYSVD